VLCTDIDMNVTFMNPVAEKMSGWQQDRPSAADPEGATYYLWRKRPADGKYHSGDMSRPISNRMWC
jgi:PAS domain-containing protein